MAIKIHSGNVIIEVDTPDELRQVLPILGERPEVAETMVKIARQHPTNFGHHDYDAFYRAMADNRQGQTLRLLGQSTDGKTDSQLREELKLKSNYELAGIMSGLSKNAKKAGFQIGEIVIKSMKKGENGEKTYCYKLTEEMAKVVNAR